MKKNNYSTPSMEVYTMHIPAQAIMTGSTHASANSLTGEIDESVWPNLF